MDRLEDGVKKLTTLLTALYGVLFGMLALEHAAGIFEATGSTMAGGLGALFSSSRYWPR